MRGNGWEAAREAVEAWKAGAAVEAVERDLRREAAGLCRVANVRRWRLLFITTTLRTCAPLLAVRRFSDPRAGECSREFRACALDIQGTAHV